MLLVEPTQMSRPTEIISVPVLIIRHSYKVALVPARLFASIVTLINEKQLAANKTIVGFLNPALYVNLGASNDVSFIFFCEAFFLLWC